MPEEVSKKTHCKNCESKYIPNYIKVPLLIEVGFKCPTKICSGISKTILEFHHIDGWSKTQTHKKERMIAVCPTCHDLLDNGEISKDYVIRLKNKLSDYLRNLVTLYSNDNPTMFVRLEREGKYRELYSKINSALIYCYKQNLFLPFLPELAIEKAKCLRKLKNANEAVKFLDKFEKKWNRELFLSHKYSIDLARGYALFNEMNFESALNHIKEYKHDKHEIQPIGSESGIFERYFRQTIINWITGISKTDLDQLHELSKKPNDKISILLARAIIEKKDVKKSWRTEVEEILNTIKEEPTLSITGYERHALAELCYLASKIFKSTEEVKLCSYIYKNYFNKHGHHAQHSIVFDFHSRKTRIYPIISKKDNS